MSSVENDYEHESTFRVAGYHAPLAFAHPRIQLWVHIKVLLCTIVGFGCVIIGVSIVPNIVLATETLDGYIRDWDVCTVLIFGPFYSSFRHASAAWWIFLVSVIVLGVCAAIECFFVNPDLCIHAHQIKNPQLPRRPLVHSLYRHFRVITRFVTLILAQIAFATLFECVLPVGVVVFTLTIEWVLLVAWLVFLCIVYVSHCCTHAGYRTSAPSVVVVAAGIVIGLAWLLPFGIHWDHFDHFMFYHWSRATSIVHTSQKGHGSESSASSIEASSLEGPGRLDTSNGDAPGVNNAYPVAIHFEETYEFWSHYIPALTPPYPIELGYGVLLVGILACVFTIRYWNQVTKTEPVETILGIIYLSSSVQLSLSGWVFLSWVVGMFSIVRRLCSNRTWW
jgi:hypothetical protein